MSFLALEFIPMLPETLKDSLQLDRDSERIPLEKLPLYRACPAILLTITFPPECVMTPLEGNNHSWMVN